MRLTPYGFFNIENYTDPIVPSNTFVNGIDNLVAFCKKIGANKKPAVAAKPFAGTGTDFSASRG